MVGKEYRKCNDRETAPDFNPCREPPGGERRRENPAENHPRASGQKVFIETSKRGRFRTVKNGRIGWARPMRQSRPQKNGKQSGNAEVSAFVSDFSETKAFFIPVSAVFRN